MSKRTQRDMESKYEIIQYYLKIKDEKGAKSKVAKQFNISQVSTLNRMLESQDAIIKEYESNQISAKRCQLTEGEFPQIDKDLYEYLTKQRANNIDVNTEDLLTHARAIAVKNKIQNFKGSIGYIRNWKSRFNVRFKTLHGEGGSVNDDILDQWLLRLPKLIEGYQAKNIFNADETGLFFKATIRHTRRTSE